MSWYGKKINSNLFNIKIDGLDVIGEDITPNESFNRRETSRKSIIGGTESVMRTTYVRRDWTFKLHLPIDPLYPNIYDSTFKTWQSKPVEIISKELGGNVPINAEIIVKRTHEKPRTLLVDVQVIEIPSATSLIPDDKVKTPTTKVVTTTSTSNKSDKSSTKSKTKTSKNNTKSSKSSKKSTKKSSKSTKKNKGSNVTKVNK